MLPSGDAFQEGIEARPNTKLHFLSREVFEDSIDVSFAAFDTPQSCAFH